MNRMSDLAAKVCMASSGLFLALLVTLHVLRPDLDPSWRFISEYELGAYGWMMRLAFFVLAVSCIGLAVAVWPFAQRASGWFGMFLLLVSSVGMILAGIFAPSTDNKLHELGAMLDNVPFAALFINWSLSRQSDWKLSKGLLLSTAGLPLAGLVIFMGSLAVMLPANGGQPGPTVLAGWPNRLFILAHLAWLVPMAWRAAWLSQRTCCQRAAPVLAE